VKRAKKRTTAAHRFRTFCRTAIPNQLAPDYIDGWALGKLTDALQRFSEAVRRKESPRLMVFMPPRHGKTMHVSEAMPVWHLGHDPWARVVLTSYSLDRAKESATRARKLLHDPRVAKIFPRLALAKDQAEKVNWQTPQGGGVRAVGVGGSLTGQPADILVIDDPIKNHVDALSATRREHVWNWYTSTAYTRLQPGGGVIVILTRWHKDDLAGRLLERAKHEGFEVLHLPAIAENDDVEADGTIHRRTGEALHPERYTLERLEKIKKSIGRRWWIALYQGQPSDPGGKIWPVELWRRWTPGPPTPEQAALGWVQRPDTFTSYVITGDLTFGSTRDSASHCDLLVFGKATLKVRPITGGEPTDLTCLFLLEEWRKQAPYPEQRAALKRLAGRYPQGPILVEDKASGKQVVDELKAEFGDRLESVSPKGDKVARAEAAVPRLEEGRVFVPMAEVAPWVVSWLDEVTDFPDATHDDRVDSAGMAIRKLSEAEAGGFFFKALRGR